MPTTFCRHIKPNGARCGSPALRDKTRCYFHDRSYIQNRLRDHRLRQADTEAAILHPLTVGPDGRQRDPLIAEYYRPRPAPLELPIIEDRASIQVALSMILAALARNEMDSQQAGRLLYGLQVASANARDLKPYSTEVPVTHTVLDEEGNELAPDEDPDDRPQFMKDLYD